jgi:SsrA-binding protein
VTATEGRKLVATNRRARFEYEILDTFEAGLVLRGPEVKSLRAGRANLSDSYAIVRRGEAFLLNAHVSPYEQAGRENPDAKRERKLLLHRREIARLTGELTARGTTLVPLAIYFKDGRAKVELGLARGKKLHDKRETIRAREEEREVQRTMRARRRGAS